MKGKKFQLKFPPVDLLPPPRDSASFHHSVIVVDFIGDPILALTASQVEAILLFLLQKEKRTTMCKVGHKPISSASSSAESFWKTLKTSAPDVCDTHQEVERAWESVVEDFPYSLRIQFEKKYNIIIFSDLIAAMLRGC